MYLQHGQSPPHPGVMWSRSQGFAPHRVQVVAGSEVSAPSAQGPGGGGHWGPMGASVAAQGEVQVEEEV